MKQKFSVLGSAGLGAGLGAGLMYLLDPEGGRQRRALARAKAVQGLKAGGRSLRGTSIHLGNKTKGLVAKASSRLRSRNRVQEGTEGASLPVESTNGNRFSLARFSPAKIKVRPRTAALGVGALAGTVGLGLLARSRMKVDDLSRPLTGSRTVRGESSAQLEW